MLAPMQQEEKLIFSITLNENLIASLVVAEIVDN